jgi:hypothetical protein
MTVVALLAVVQVVIIGLWLVGALLWPWWVVFLVVPPTLFLVLVMTVVVALYVVSRPRENP